MTMTENRLLLDVRELKKYFPVREGVLARTRRWVRAVDRVSFSVSRGETLGLVGESGCGKTTAGRSVLRLTEPTGGEVNFDGQNLTGLNSRDLRAVRPRMQIVFQDPYSSLNPRHVILDTVGEGLVEHRRVRNRTEQKDRVAEILETVGLSAGILYRYPHEFSGGQRQRIAIARAISLKPELLVLDEPVSALDVSIQAQIINLLTDLQARLGMAYLFIAHDLAVVKHISRRIAVMYLGQIVETAPSDELFEHPAHPYTRALLSAIPVPDPDRKKSRTILTGEIGGLPDSFKGCCFADRCPLVQDECRQSEPEEICVGRGHTAKCLFAGKTE